MKVVVILFATLATVSCSTLQERAQTAAIADSVTTAAGITAGLAEVNPLGWATIPAKVAALAYAQTLPDDEAAAFHASVGPIWSGVAVSNVCLLTCVACAPACVLAGFGVALQQWHVSREEREFHERCAAYRRAVGGVFRCVYRMADIGV